MVGIELGSCMLGKCLIHYYLPGTLGSSEGSEILVHFKNYFVGSQVTVGMEVWFWLIAVKFNKLVVRAVLDQPSQMCSEEVQSKFCLLIFAFATYCTYGKWELWSQLSFVVYIFFSICSRVRCPIKDNSFQYTVPHEDSLSASSSASSFDPVGDFPATFQKPNNSLKMRKLKPAAASDLEGIS